ncbi:MAG: VOC family protein [Acidobacteria bacterium]|nr:VOC family protein [Acidobacteriota bacterium]
MATKKSAKKKAPAKAKPAAAKSNAKKAASPKRSEPESLRLRAVSPSFTVNDLEASLKWYRDVMGFTEGKRYDDKGKLVGVELLAGEAFFMLGQDDWKKGKNRAKGEGMRLYCMTVQDVDVLAAEIRARGGKLDQPPTDQPWGMRDFSVTDPDGFKITIARELGK